MIPELTIPMVEYKSNTYGIMHESIRRYLVTGWGNARIGVRNWLNSNRPNPRNGQPVRYAPEREQGYVIDGGNGVYLDPSNRATNDPFSVLISEDSWSGRPICSERLTDGALVRLGFYYNFDSFERQDCVLHLDYTVKLESRYYGRLIPVAS